MRTYALKAMTHKQMCSVMIITTYKSRSLAYCSNKIMLLLLVKLIEFYNVFKII